MTDNDTEFVSYQQWDRFARRIEGKNLREHGRSLSFSGIANLARDYIIEIRPGRDDEHGVMLVKRGWRDAMRAREAEWMTANQGGKHDTQTRT